MRKQNIKQKNVVVTYCEGEAEILLFEFLKTQYSNRKISFRNPIDLEGVSDFPSFKRKYEKKVKELGIKPAKDYENIRLLFIIDNDLADSAEIKAFIESKNHKLIRTGTACFSWQRKCASTSYF